MRLYYFVSSKWALDDLKRGRLKLATFTDMNDPFEMLPCELGDRETRRRFNFWRDMKAASAAALCFSRKWSDPVIWSHYADRHHGVALAFDAPRPMFDPVRYQEARITDLLPRLHFGNDAEMVNAMRELFTTKYKRWEYEAEWRHMTDTFGKESDGKNFYFPFHPWLKLRAVLLGARFDGARGDFEQVLREKHKGADLIATRVAFKTYQIVRQRRIPVWAA